MISYCSPSVYVAMGDLVGLTVNRRYEVSKKLQAGFYGATWLARDNQTREDVCLKTFFSEGASQQKELAVLRELCEGHFNHDNLCRVLDVSLDRTPVLSWKGEVQFNTQYVVFEYCSGSDLFNFLVTGPFEKTKRVSSFSEPLARHYFMQALLAVVYLHERGVFHRDIKPENCVLDGHFNLKLTDFGTNKILPISEDPGQVLRTATTGIGTDSYRAPEVNGYHSYDPSAADVWSLGVTLFILVGIHSMVTRVRLLDPYMRQVLAPLGLLFPFPLHCSKLDSYMKSEGLLQQAMATRGGGALPNDQFWSEWADLRAVFSLQLYDLFNRVFVLVPSLRCSLQEMLRHSWVASGTRLTPEEVRTQMEARCPSDVQPRRDASPSVMSQRLLGGVDQATLRQSLSRHGNEAAVYLQDSELWRAGDALTRLESLQLDIVSTDVQELMMDVNFIRQVLRDVLSSPQSAAPRTVRVEDIRHSSWVGNMLSILGFLPQGRVIYLPVDAIDLTLLQQAMHIVEGIELAVARSAIPVASTEEEDEDHMITDQSDPSSAEGYLPAMPSAGDSGHSSLHNHTTSEDNVILPPSLPPHHSHLPPVHIPLQRYSSDAEMEPLMVTTPGGSVAMATTPGGSVVMATTLGGSLISPPANTPDMSSQESAFWTQYTLSTQSSQEECPEAFVSHDWSHEHSLLLELATVVHQREPKQYRAAAEFCKLSGMLCSYGLYQVVCNDQLALYCRGNAASFSARVIAIDTSGKIGISSWCFHGNEEWHAIMERVSRDMTPQRTTL